MSVYTHLTHTEIEQILSGYDLGHLISFKGIESGVENTNYFLDVEKNGVRQRYVLTLFEYQPASALPFFIDYTDELKTHDLPVPNPVRDKKGHALQSVKDKPTLIVQCFPGKHPDHKNLSLDQCEQIGEMLGRVHLAGMDSKLHQENHRGVAWLNVQKERLVPLLSQDDSLFMSQQWNNISTSLQTFSELPTGLIHGDLFHNNVLFDGGKISAVIDFYQACSDWLVYDLAVTVNDWCLEEGLELSSQKQNALIEAYTKIRPLTHEEKTAWPVMLRLAAFRFWVSRLITFIHPESQMDDEHKESLIRAFLDPDEFKNMLILRSNQHALK
ncbi:homoserine kinase [Endozoicomonas ascidiicola]|uniref:homoserine kinase n=1 Tax=Endozoicomonas ascidiicola TaxID=1698521 RepID=UPI000AA652C9|nr:homoserine kinase [Endozoicomonas ascidiicola]